MISKQFFVDYCPNLNAEQHEQAVELANNMLGALRALPVIQEDVQISRDDLLELLAVMTAGAGVQAMSSALDAYEAAQKKNIVMEVVLENIVKQVGVVEHYAEMYGHKASPPSAIHIALGAITQYAEYGLGRRKVAA